MQPNLVLPDSSASRRANASTANGWFICSSGLTQPPITYCDNQAVQVSLLLSLSQVVFPFSVTFAAQNANNTGATNLYPWFCWSDGPLPGRTSLLLNGIATLPVMTALSRDKPHWCSDKRCCCWSDGNIPYATPGFSSITVIVKTDSVTFFLPTTNDFYRWWFASS